MSETMRTLTIELLYLDDTVCERCIGTRQALDAAIEAARPALMALGTSVAVDAVHVTSLEQARDVGLQLSPTIRIDGQDVQPEGFRNTCGECGDLCDCPGGVDCRVWRWQGQDHLVPPVAMLVQAVMARAISDDTPAVEDQPGNAEPIERFFGAKAPAGSCCAPDCCP